MYSLEQVNKCAAYVFPQSPISAQVADVASGSQNSYLLDLPAALTHLSSVKLEVRK